MCKIIAVDFDGTLCINDYPNIGNPNIALIQYLKFRKSCGDKLILWTCRSGDDLEKAVDWCEWHGLYFDAVNNNLPESIELFGSDTRKVFAHLYIDDCASSNILTYTPSMQKDLYESDDNMVSHPSHYISNGMETVDVIKAFTKDLTGIEAAFTANIIKYACRWKNKGGVQDLEKLIWYATYLVNELKKEQKRGDA